MKIAFVSLMFDAPWGGSEVLWAAIAAEALVAGHEVLVSVYSWPEVATPIQALAAAGARVEWRARYHTNFYERTKIWLKRLPLQGQTPEVQALVSFKPDVVFVNQAGYKEVLYHSHLHAWLSKVPFVLACHNYEDPVRQQGFPTKALAALYNQAREVLMISTKQLQTIQRQLAANIPNATVIQNPLNLPAVYPVPLRAAPTENARLAVVGSLDVDRKGQEVLLAALTAPQWCERRVQVRFYGKGPDQAYLERVIAFYGLSHQVELCGHTADATTLWEQTDLLVIPSRIESGPMVLQEAMLCGRPVVAADVGMVREWLDEGETGFIADTASPESLNAAFTRAWVRRSDWLAMGQLAYERASARLQLTPARQQLNRLLTFASPKAVGLPGEQ